MKLLKSVLVAAAIGLSGARADTLPEGFVDLSTLDKTIPIELRYNSEWNFMGRVVTGYFANRCYLTKPAAEALVKVQVQLMRKGLSLLMIDCYRPQRAVSEFMKWSQDLTDLKMKEIFYPEEPKNLLIERGYIAEKSGHTRGSTVDLTLIKKPKVLPSESEILKYKEKPVDCRYQTDILKTGQLDMGTMVDCFSEMSNTDNGKISEGAKKNRMVLKNVMEKNGFSHYPKEWWHFTLKNEPFKDKYFDFEIR